MTDIFLSYTERDRDTARRVAEALGAAGWSVWWDRRIPAGETWRGVLAHALEDMRCMVVLWSAKSIESEWVYEEASEGRRQGKLVPVMIEAVRPPAGFREIQAADLTGWDGSSDFEGLRLLLADLENLLGKPAAGRGKQPYSGKKAPIVATDNANDLPYGDTELPGFKSHAPDPKPRWPRWALAGGLLLLAALVTVSVSRRHDDTPPAAKSPITESAKANAAVATPPPTDGTTSGEQSSKSTHVPAPSTGDVPSTLTQLRTKTLTTSSVVKHKDTSRPDRACAEWLLKLQLGEALSEAEQGQFNARCRK